ncbi:DUF4244 domain-containing protein [Arthrobacter sp. SW1]|uniref:DUF4244 domain-containing protein n=1 Tax=Arthrobacter sp. SW1 TaxID=1920889 RepID=UPI000A5584DB|nr:DUF4244 domain-containing protein [Arthrobacter sp. SW1]
MKSQTMTRPAADPGPGEDACGGSPRASESPTVSRDAKLADVVELFPGQPAEAETSGSKRRPRLMASELGMATAEYAIATLAAVGFAGVLVVLLRSEEVRSFLLNLIRTALALP